MDNQAKTKIGLVLEGGGVKGAYQAGALKALCEAGCDFQGVSGTSIGAINGALYLQGGIDLVMKVWNEMRFTTVFDITDEEIKLFKKHQYFPVIHEYVARRFQDKVGLIAASYEKSQKYFKSLANEEAIRNSGKDFGLVTFCISDFAPVEKMMYGIGNGLLIDYIIASANFPGFPAMVIDGKRYIDGGVYDNMPINLLSQNGYDKMLVLRTNPMTDKPSRRIERQDLDIRYIAPKKDLGFAMSFTSSNVKKFLQMGYEDTIFQLDNGLKDFLLETI